MTIDDVMEIATQLCRDYAEYTKNSTYSPIMYSQRDELRAAILALLDAEAEECAMSVHLTRIESEGDSGHDRGVSGWLAKAEERVRYRIAARKGGAKP